MKVVHLCLSCFYIEGGSYQENELVRAHVMSGHTVRVVASRLQHDDEGGLAFGPVMDYTNSVGAHVRRIAYGRLLPAWLASKLGVYRNLSRELESFQPEVVMYHGTGGLALATVARWVAAHPGVVFHIDCHADKGNSATNPASRLLSKWIFAPILRNALRMGTPLLCITAETQAFAQDVYGIPSTRSEPFPLGAATYDDATYELIRQRGRAKYGATDQSKLFVQTGKFAPQKRLDWTLAAFSELPGPDLKLVVAGTGDAKFHAALRAAIAQDARITYAGWLSAPDMAELLCAADAYLQPGTQSVTMQQSLGARCATVVATTPAHQFVASAVAFSASNFDQYRQALETLAAQDLRPYQERAAQFAAAHLDYRVLADRILRAG